jgi:hypothetical protein
MSAVIMSAQAGEQPADVAQRAEPGKVALDVWLVLFAAGLVLAGVTASPSMSKSPPTTPSLKR